MTTDRWLACRVWRRVSLRGVDWRLRALFWSVVSIFLLELIRMVFA